MKSEEDLRKVARDAPNPINQKVDAGDEPADRREDEAGRVSRDAGLSRMNEALSDRGLATRELIVATSTKLFAERGYAATTLRGLAEQSGLQLSAFYYYFPRKHDVLTAIMSEAMSRLEDAAREVLTRQTSVAERLAALVRAHVWVHLSIPDAARVTDGELSALEPEAREEIVARRDNYEASFRQTLAEGCRTGDFSPDLEVAVAAMSILSMGTAVIDWWRPDGRLDAEETARCIARFALAIATQGGAGATAVSWPPTEPEGTPRSARATR
jgi:AcrR family transcriptional regulator